MLSDSKLSKKDKFMRVLLINTSERIGGAAVAASRLMESLKNNGIKAKLLVRDKQTDRITVVSLSHNWRMVWKFVWERIVIWKANRFKRDNIFAVDIANTGTDITTLPEFQQADIIHLHWINQGMLSKEHRKDSCFGQACSLDHARYVAMHRHLPLRTGVQQLSAGMSRLPLHLQRRWPERNRLPD